MANNPKIPPGEGEQLNTPQAGSPATESSAFAEQPTDGVQPVSPTIYDRTTEPYKAVAKPEALSSNLKSTPLIDVRDLKKTYHLGQTRVLALRGVSMEVYPGEFVAIRGPSGSGKSTFMNLIGCLDRPTAGEYWLNGKLVSRLSSDQLADIRNRLIGFVFQGFNLLARATALSNVALPLVYAGLPREERERRARKMLQVIGLGDRLHHKPAELSGGQQQRVAIARALVNGPSLLLADEPTGNLDSRTSLEIMAVLQALNQQGLTIVLVTHEADIAAFARRQVAFRDGRIVRDEPNLAPRSAEEAWAALARTHPDASKVEIEEETQ